MKRSIFALIFFGVAFFCTKEAAAQCSVCTKSAQQMGEGPAKGLNQGILYLMIAPFAIVGYIGYRWWKNNKKIEEQEQAG